MNDYDIWAGFTSLTPLNYFGGIAIMAFFIWIFGGFRDKNKRK